MAQVAGKWSVASARSPHVASFRIEPGVSFCAHTASFRRGLLPLAYDWVEVVIVLDGTGEAVVHDGGRRSPVGPGSVVFLMPNTPFGLWPDATMTVSRVFISADYLWDQIRYQHPHAAFDKTSAALHSQTMFPDPAQIITLDPPALDLVSTATADLARLTTSLSVLENHYMAQCRVSHVLGTVMPRLHRAPCPLCGEMKGMETRASLPRMSAMHPLSPPVRTALTWVEGHYRESWTLAELAQVAAMSPSGLEAAFVAQLGKTPQAYRDALRVRALARLLVEAHLSVSDAAHTVGWASVTQASHTFLSVTRLTPGKWRDVFHATVQHGIAEPQDLLLEPQDLTQFRI